MNKQRLTSFASVQRGFTLIELLVVVSVLAAIAGITAVAMDNYHSEARDKLTKIEMKQVAKAIYRFRVDTGYWPKTGIFSTTALGLDSGTNPTDVQHDFPENMSWLFKQADDFAYKEALPWSTANARGWNPNYVDNGARRTLATASCSLSQTAFNASISGGGNNIDAISDVYERDRASYGIGEFCFAASNENGWKQVLGAGSPYLYKADFYKTGNLECNSSTDTCVVLQSYGKNGIDDDGADASDDIILVLNHNAS